MAALFPADATPTIEPGSLPLFTTASEFSGRKLGPRVRIDDVEAVGLASGDRGRRLVHGKLRGHPIRDRLAGDPVGR